MSIHDLWKKNRMISAWVVVAMAILATGCSKINSFPQQARGGDTITLAVGSPNGMNRANTTLKFIPDSYPADPKVDLTPGIRGIFKLRPDPTSHHWLASASGADPVGSITNNDAHGPWQQIIVFDLPPGLAVGSGVVRVTTDADYGYTQEKIKRFNIEILPGIGQRDDFEYWVPGWDGNPAVENK